MGRIAISISHESDYAVAIAFGVRSAGGRYVFPLDIDERLDDRERRLLARFDRLRRLDADTRAAAAGVAAQTTGVATQAAGDEAGAAADGHRGDGREGDGRG